MKLQFFIVLFHSTLVTISSPVISYSHGVTVFIYTSINFLIYNNTEFKYSRCLPNRKKTFLLVFLALLFLQVASRALTFLQNTVGELNILEVNVAPGGVACWGVLSCLEVTDALHRYHTTDAHALHTAPLWAYARDKVDSCFLFFFSFFKSLGD